MKLHNGSNSEMVRRAWWPFEEAARWSLTGRSLGLQVLYSYSIGFVYILTGLLCVGGLGPAVAFCSEASTV